MYKGTSASAGIGIGKAVIVEEAQLVITRQAVNNVEEEVQRFKGALDETIKATEKLAEDLATRVGEKEAEIMQGHMMLLADPMLTGEIENSVRNDGVNSEYAIENVCNMYADMFASMGDELMQQRATDMRDIKTRMQQMLMGIQSVDISSLPEGSIIVAKDLTPSMTAGINPANVTGIVTELGGKTSHSAILARALEIPAVVAVTGFMDGVKDGDQVVLDGSTGEVYVNPDQAVTADYEEKRKQFLAEKKELEQYIGKPSVTKDGVQVEIVANIGKPEDVDKVLQYDGEGIGLFRTEFLFMDRNAMPTEEEQFEAYKKVAAAMNGKPVIIRTLDIGGDKEIPYMGLEKDENPFLGYRAIRFCLDRREDVYKPQLRALLRASAFGNIRIMVPLVTCIEEYRQAKALVEEIKKELDEKGIAYNKDIQVGIMVETAAASLIADIFAKEADFFSIGTNDLTQYTMSVDRGNKKVSYLYSTFNPAVLRSIKHIIACGREAGIMVGMCGEAASDPMMIPLLLAFGLNEFSNKDIQVGIMVETAAASLIADIFAKEADFFSIGTNDLTQYTMSVDRGNKKVSYLYSTFNPAVLRSIKHIIACGREAGIMVGMCGEAASDPMMIPLLLAFGLNEFSMSASAILKARKMVTQYSVEELQAVADKAMSFATTAETEQYMRDFVEKVTD